MSPAIDERVVQMEFDNSRFEKNVSTSISTLDRLKGALKLNGVTDGLTAVEKHASRFNLSGIGSAVETISGRFSALGIMGTRILQNLADEAYRAGKRIVNSLTLDQINAGWDKYAEKTTSVQTIMAATEKTWESSAKALKFQGTQMEFVNSQMDKLNWFTDETSYSFTDMVSNIGKFTANNIPLETSVTAMQGIANWAAISGQTAQSASRAMYNLAQAIGVGSVKLMDWKSIENANMATAGFKEKVLEVAAANGKLKKSVDKTGKTIYKTVKGTEVSVESFSQTLSEAWFDKNTLLSVLNQYGSFTNQLYEFSEATGLTATDILSLIEAQEKGTLSTKDLAQAAAEAGMSTEEFKKQLASLGSEQNRFGREAFKAAQEAKTFQDAIDATKDAASTKWMNIFENIFGDYEKARHVWTDFANFLYDTLVSPLEKIEELSEGLKAPFDTFKQLMNNVSDSTGKSKGAILELVKGLRDGTITQDQLNASTEKGLMVQSKLSTVKGKVVKTQNDLNKSLEEASVSEEEFSAMLEELSSDIYGDYIDAIFEASDKTGLSVRSLYDLVEAQTQGKLSTEELEKAAKKAGISIEDLRGIIDDLAAVGQKTGLDRIVEGLTGIWDFLFNRDTKQPGIIGAIMNGFQSVIKPIELTKEAIHNAVKWFGDFGSSLETNGWYINKFRQAGVALGKVVQFIGNSFRNFWNATSSLRTSLANLAESVGTVILRFVASGNGLDTTGIKFEGLKTICDVLAKVIEKVAGAIKNIDVEGLKKKFSGLSSIFSALSSAVNWVFGQIANINFAGAFDTAINWIKEKFAALKAYLSEFDWGNIFKGLAGGGILALIGTWLIKTIKNIKSPFESLKNIGDKLGGVLDSLKSTLSSFETGIKVDGFKKIATAILILAAALLVLSFVDYEKAVIGVGLLATIMTGLVTAMEGIGKIDKGRIAVVAASLMMAAAAMLIMAVALAALAGALALFTLVSKMDNVSDGFAIMAGTLALVLVALKVMSKMSPKVIVAAAALAIFAASLLILALAIAAFAKVAEMNNVWKGIAIMAMSLLILVAALVVLNEVALGAIAGAAALLIVSAALLVLAAALWAFTEIAGMENFGAGAGTMVVMILALTAALIGLGLVGPAVLAGAAALLVGAAACIALAIAVGIVSAVLPLLGSGLAALGEGIGSAVASIGAGVGEFLSGVAEGITATGEALGSMVADIGSGIGEAVAGLGTGVAEAITAIIASVGEGIGQGITSISDAIGSFGENLTLASNGITELGNSVRSLNGISWTSTAIGIGELSGALKKLNPADLAANMGPAADAVTSMCTSMVDAVSSAVPTVTSSAEQLGTGIVSGITGKLTIISPSVRSVLASCVSIISSYVGSWSSVGANLGQGLANGISSKISAVASAARSMVRAAITAARAEAQEASPSKVTTRSGEFFGQGYANGILSKTSTVSAAAKTMVRSSIKTLDNARNLISRILEDDFEPVITPVLDTSKITNTLSSISGVSIKAGTISTGMQELQNARNSTITNSNDYSSRNTINLYVDGIKYNTDDYVDSTITNFVETMVRKQKMYAGG